MKRETFDFSALKKKISEIESHEEAGCCEGHDTAEEIPLDIKRRVHALHGLQSKRVAIAAAFRMELLDLERKYLAKYAPLNEERAKIVCGIREPTDEELSDFTSSGVEEVAHSSSTKEALGIPEFWVIALQTHPNIQALITEADADALKSLRDIRVAYFSDKPGFKLEFEFAPNEYFSNALLTKEYHLAVPDADDGNYDDFVYDHAVGTEIDWKPGKNLCFKSVVRTQRHRTTNSTRTVKRDEPQKSFFHFFVPPVLPEEETDDEDADELEARLHMDYELGEILKEHIVPNAVDWYTGEALEYAELEDDEDYYDDELEEDEDDFDEEEDEESEEEEEEATPRRHISRPGGTRRATSSGKSNPEECKQQ